MALATRLSSITVLQNAQAAAANGTAMDASDATELMVEVSGTYTNITANFEASIDGGSTWHSISLLQVSSLTSARIAAATAVGLYRLETAKGINAFRARTTIGAATGAMTVKAVSGLW
jgi:hypothetical protein